MINTANRYFVIHKPANMVSQFVSSHDVTLLGNLNFDFPEGTHAIGRLDNHSEGLLLLTTNKRVTKLLFQGKQPHPRTYLVQVRYVVADDTINQLRAGVSIRVKGGEYYITQPCEVSIVDNPELYISLAADKKTYKPHTWLAITLTEGKFHQVRKMVAVMGHRCTRLIRISIENLMLGSLQSGEVKEMEETEFFSLLSIHP
jgi:23S rRNA pseudouridine2457 synthase